MRIDSLGNKEFLAAWIKKNRRIGFGGIRLGDGELIDPSSYRRHSRIRLRCRRRSDLPWRCLQAVRYRRALGYPSRSYGTSYWNSPFIRSSLEQEHYKDKINDCFLIAFSESVFRKRFQKKCRIYRIKIISKALFIYHFKK